MKFELDDVERARFIAWNKKHLDDHHGGLEPYTGAAGGRESFIFTPTGIGTCISVRCGVCYYRGKPKEVHTESLTNFDTW